MCAPVAKMCRPRDPVASPFFRLVRDHFDEFECVYDERFQPKYGYWRPVIRTAIDKFLKCVDLREGFARVRCPDCGVEFFVAFSCRQRCCCPSCDQKRALLPGIRLAEEVCAAGIAPPMGIDHAEAVADLYHQHGIGNHGPLIIEKPPDYIRGPFFIPCIERLHYPCEEVSNLFASCF